MCGIAGFYSGGRELSAHHLKQMVDCLIHRGPDDEGYFGVHAGGKKLLGEALLAQPEGLCLGLGFRRLAILDLSRNGSQPMQTPDGRHTLIFNGQIYNYVELRERLLGVSFRSSSDTEVLLHLLAQFGLGILSELNGMFAFAWYDALEQKLRLARDPMGVKPLYYHQSQNTLRFASEIRSLLATGISPRLNRSAVSSYLMSHYSPDPETLFEGIKKLPAGHFVELDLQKSLSALQPRRYWDLSFSPNSDLPESEAILGLENVLAGAVERQLRSDVPVGFFLSGGVDSSLLVAKALSVQKLPPTTFTIGFKWGNESQENLDLISARRLKEKFNFAYREILLEPSVVQLLPKVIQTLEEPVADPAALCSYLLCEQARQGDYRVLVSGQGGDEVFGGYAVYPAGLLVDKMKGFGPSLLATFQELLTKLPYSVGQRKFQVLHRLKRILEASQQKWPESFFYLRSAYEKASMQSLLLEPFTFGSFTIGDQTENFDPLHQMLYWDTKNYLSASNLTYSDKTSMAHSVELRVPFLDLEMVRFAQKVPSHYKANLREQKILLKKVAEKILPREVVHRPKSGFGFPVGQWFSKDLAPLAQELFSPSRLSAQKLFSPELPMRWLQEHQTSRADHSMRLYNLLTFQLWIEAFAVRS